MKKSDALLLEDYMSIPAFSNTIEVPADVLLYLILKNNGFDTIVTKKEIEEYQRALIDASRKYADQITETLAFYLPAKENIQPGLFAEVLLQDGSYGFELKATKGKAARELQEYRLARLECFSLAQRKVVRNMFALAQSYYQDRSFGQESHYKKITTPVASIVKEKVLGMSKAIKHKLSSSHN